MDRSVTEKILELIADVESSNEVVVLFAVESGSRAWGFPSRDSDYDVRFVYIRRQSWYLSIDLELRRDVIEQPIKDEIDLSGWDIQKALRLFAKANPPLIEWLSSPIVYKEEDGFRSDLSALLPEYYSPQRCMYHYMHMAARNYRDYLKGPVVWTKKYLYVLRPVLAVKWIREGRGPVPMEFGRLLATIADQPELQEAIRILIERKRNGEELDRGPENSTISNFIETEMIVQTENQSTRAFGALDYGHLQSCFLKWLEKAWSGKTTT